MNKNQLQLIEHLENSLCVYEYPEQQSLEEVETYCKWFDLNENEKQEIVNHFSTEWSDYQWVSEMIKDVFTYTKYDPSLISLVKDLDMSTINH